MLEIVPPGTRIDFLRKFPIALAVSAVVILVGVVMLFVRGPRYGIDFAGGTLVHVRFQEPVAIGEIRTALGGLAGGDFTVQDFGGGSDEFLVRMPEADPELKKGLPAQVEESLRKSFGDAAGLEILRVESVGPRIGEDLRRRGILAIFAATLMMGLYIAFRFELRFGIGVAAALVHDSLVTISALVIANYEFDLTVVAALLTVIGYSVNDTVVVSDRIRENLRKQGRETLDALINRSLNETLSRTVLTTGTTLLVIFALFYLGGEVIHGFAFTLLAGFIAGTYSSVFIASPVVLFFGSHRGSLAGSSAAEGR